MGERVGEGEAKERERGTSQERRDEENDARRNKIDWPTDQ